jgi:hypothetical protein
LNDGQIPNPNVVRVAPSTRYHRVEGNRRAISHPKSLSLRFATFASLHLAPRHPQADVRRHKLRQSTVRRRRHLQYNSLDVQQGSLKCIRGFKGSLKLTAAAGCVLSLSAAWSARTSRWETLLDHPRGACSPSARAWKGLDRCTPMKKRIVTAGISVWEVAHAAVSRRPPISSTRL